MNVTRNSVYVYVYGVNTEAYSQDFCWVNPRFRHIFLSLHCEAEKFPFFSFFQDWAEGGTYPPPWSVGMEFIPWHAALGKMRDYMQSGES